MPVSIPKVTTVEAMEKISIPKKLEPTKINPIMPHTKNAEITRPKTFNMN